MTDHDDLADFVANRMRMSHIYQPVMLLELLRNDGSASTSTSSRVGRAMCPTRPEGFEE